MSNKKIFDKQALSIDEQITSLQKHGLYISDIEHAKHCLGTVGYYRLSGYFKPFRTVSTYESSFQDGSTFDQIWDIYAFDRELRLLFLDMPERIEIALRTAMSNHLSLKYGPLWYTLNDCFHERWTDFSKKSGQSPSDYFKKEVNQICQKEREEFIKHYFTKYNHPTYPPSWMIMECLSFGKTLNLFRYLGKVSDKAAISKLFGYHPKVIESCLITLRYTRNVCAHHARLWNRWFVIIPKHIRAFSPIQTNQRSLHQQAIVVHALNKAISLNSDWQNRLFSLFEKHQENVPFRLMGFQKDWQNDPFWGL